MTSVLSWKRVWVSVCLAGTVAAALALSGSPAFAHRAEAQTSSCPSGALCVPATYSGTAQWTYGGGASTETVSGSQSWSEQFTVSVAGSGATSSKGDLSLSAYGTYAAGSSTNTGTGEVSAPESYEDCSGSLSPLPAGTGFAPAPTLSGAVSGQTATFTASATILSGCGGGTLDDGATDGFANSIVQALLPSQLASVGTFPAMFTFNAKQWLETGSTSAGPVSYSYEADINGNTLSFSWTGKLTIGNPCSLSDSSGGELEHRTGRAANASSSSSGPLAMYVNGQAIPSTQKKVSQAKVNNKSQPIVAGEELKLAVECLGQQQNAASWKLQGNSSNGRVSSVLGSYDIHDAGKDSYVHGDLVKTSGSEIVVHFMRASDSGFQVTAKVDGRSVTKTFVVTEPQVYAARFRTCKVNVNHAAALGIPLIGQGAAASVGPGRNISCPLFFWEDSFSSGNPGIAWRYSVDANQGQDGKLGLVQLISTQKTHDGVQCERVNQAADLSAFYDSTAKPERAFVDTDSSRSAVYWDRDSPGLSLALKSGGTWYESFYARDFLMWKSDLPDSVWVPLGGTNWSWFARVKQVAHGAWRLIASRDIGSPPFMSDVETPYFSSVFNPAQSGCS